MKESDNSGASRSIETSYSITTIQDGIAQCVFKDIEEVDVTIARASVEDRIEFFRGVSYPCLFDITRVKRSTKEARDYLANQGSELVTASAILTTSPLIKMMANFFIMVNKPANPTRMFTDKESALEWLNQFKKQDQFQDQNNL